MEISLISEQDVQELAELYQQLIPNELSYSKMQDVLKRNKDNPNHIVLAAKIDGKLVGSIVSCNL